LKISHVYSMPSSIKSFK